MDNFTTQYGFNFGSIRAERTCNDLKTGVAIITIKTPKSRFSVRATKTGFIKFYDEDGNECELVNKDYIDQLTKKIN